MADINKIPFLDLVTPHRELENELLGVVQQILRSGAFVGGSAVEGFERAFGNFCETRHCVAVSSGTDALRFALMAVGVGPGDAVVTVPNTFIATAEAITQAGAAIEFVDVDVHSYNMDPAKLNDFLENKCTCGPDGALISNRTGKRVAAVIPVHLYGQMADMDPIVALAEHHNLVVIEDACQAHGAEYFSRKLNRWCKAGSMGRAAAFSFYPGKNLGACGEGGAVVTNDDAVAGKIRMVRDHGQEEKYYHLVEGYNGRLDAIQAGMLSVKLAHLERWNRKRQDAASRYGVLLRSVTDTITLPQEPTWSKAVHHLYVIRTQQRDQLRAHLSEAGIGTGIHYPIPLHLQKAYVRLGYKLGDFPVVEGCATEILSLPMYPQIEEEQLERVARSVTAFARQALTKPIAA